MKTEVTYLYGLPIVACSDLKPDEFFVMSQGEVRKMIYNHDDRPNLVKSMAVDRLNTLYEYVIEKLPSVKVDVMHEPEAQLQFKIGGGVKRKYWEKVILPMFVNYARDWNAELRFTFTEFGVSTRWHWNEPFKVVAYPDNASLLSEAEFSKQEEFFDKLALRGL
jgi:hypothetical protein